jgi:hypothetical protein
LSEKLTQDKDVNQISKSYTRSNSGLQDETSFPLSVISNFSEPGRTFEATIKHGFKRRVVLDVHRIDISTQQKARGGITLNKIGRVEKGYGKTYQVRTALVPAFQLKHGQSTLNTATQFQTIGATFKSTTRPSCGTEKATLRVQTGRSDCKLSQQGILSRPPREIDLARGGKLFSFASQES